MTDLAEMKVGYDYAGHYRYMVTVGDNEVYYHDDEMVANRVAIQKHGKLWVLAELGTTTYRQLVDYSK